MIFFRNAEGAAVMMNGVRYRQYSINFAPKNAGVKHRHLMVPTGWFYVPHNHKKYQFIERIIW